jgi:hypothetical protein
MQMTRLALILGTLALWVVPVQAIDLIKIPRTIAKEPVYKNKPEYCLLVFGPEAKTRVWLVRDGDVLYADRNGNGDLTEKGERCAGAKAADCVRWHIGDIVEADGKTRHTNLEVRFESRWSSFLLLLTTAQGLHQEVGNEVGQLHFADKARDAPIVHIAGPLTFLLPSPPKLIPGQDAHFIALIGTAGLGEGAATYSHIQDFWMLRMLVEVEFPKRASDVSVRVRGVQTDY